MGVRYFLVFVGFEVDVYSLRWALAVLCGGVFVVRRVEVFGIWRRGSFFFGFVFYSRCIWFRLEFIWNE